MVKINSLLLKGLALPLLIISACNGAQNSSDVTVKAKKLTKQEAPAYKSDDLARADTAAASPQAITPPAQGPAAPRQSPPLEPDFLLVKESSLELSVTELPHTADKIRHWLENSGGYYATWSQEQAGDQLSLELTAKIPASHYDSFKDSVRSIGILQKESGDARDLMDSLFEVLSTQTLQGKIGSQYSDLVQKVKKGEDMISAQQQAQAAEEAEAGANLGKILLHREAAITTIHVQLFMPHPAPAESFLPRLSNSLSEGLHGVERVIVFLAALWPLGLLCGIILMGIRVTRKSITKTT